MTERRPSSHLVAILVAFIGLVGSLGGAWLATQTKFSQELEGKSGELTRLRSDITEMKKDVELAQIKLTHQQQELDKKVTLANERLKKLDDQIELAKSSVAAVSNTTIGLFGKKKKDQP